jgi:uncharacterized surface protein with fasciclin (FAS1) repeats
MKSLKWIATISILILFSRSSIGQVYNVTFQVNMAQVTDVYTAPEVNGTFNGWCGGCAPMTDADGDNIWEITIDLEPGSHEYKYAADSWNIHENLLVSPGCVSDGFGGAVRNLIVVGDTVLPVVNWGECNQTSIWSIIQNIPDFSILESLILAADLDEELSSVPNITVFAPTNGAFSQLPQGTLDYLLDEANQQILIQILNYHFLPSFLVSTGMYNGQTVFTVQGEDITVTINGQGVFINAAQIIVADLLAGAQNSALHVIDSVLLPSCLLPGCNDPNACNYNSIATCDNGTCTGIRGCLDVNACNYNPNATCEGGQCLQVDECGECGGNSVLGCTNPLACNFDSQAGCDNGSCLFLDACGECGGNGILGCTDPVACNYNSNATCNSGTCFYPDCSTAQVQVTFNVDMSNQIINPAGVRIAGNFNDVNYDGFPENPGLLNWNPLAYPLTDPDGDMIYSRTFNLLVNEIYQFKFINGNSWGQEETVPNACNVGGGNNNRYLVVTDVSQYSTCFAQCTSCGDNAVLLQVDMSLVDLDGDGIGGEIGGDDIHPEGVFVLGDMPGSEWTNFLPLTDYDGDKIWQTVLNVEQLNTIEYKFTNGPGFSFPSESIDSPCGAGNGNRELAVEENTIQPPYCWNSCEVCFQENNVIISVDISNYCGDYSNGVVVNVIDFDIFEMEDPDGDGVYTVTLSLLPGDYLYWFSIIGEGWDGIYRSINVSVGNLQVLETVCFGSDGPCDGSTIFGCADQNACNYNPMVNCETNSCVFPGCMDTNACNFNASAGCDDGSCLFFNLSCNDGDSNTMLDETDDLCNCVGTPFSYGNIASSSISLCPGAVTNAITASVPLNITDYSVQWYYKEGTFTCPSGASNAGWIAVDGATSLSYTPTEFAGTRTFACFMSPSSIYNIPNQWIPGCRVISYYVFDAQPIIGNPNIAPFSTVTYAVNPIASNTFNWTVSNGAIVSGQGTSVIQVLWGQNGPYQVSLTESNGTCSDISTLLVVNSSCSLSAAITSTNSNAFCPGGTNELIASSNGTNLSYTWYLNGVEIANATEQSFGINSAGNYQVMVNDGLCSAVSQILNITQLPGVQWPEITVFEQNVDCVSASATITATGGNANSYEWSNGETSAEIIVTESGEYVLTATNDSGCSAELPPVVINFAQSEPLPICLVTVNADNGFNIIVWEPQTSEVIVNYVVLKETNAANQYEVIGTVPYGSDGLFEDVNSNSAVQASRYKLAINDLCNVVSTNSPLHKTIHLTSNVGLNNTVNLIWSHYEGADFLSYNIYRGSNPADMTLLATIASNLNSYTDLNPLLGNAYYFIEVEGIACDPSRSIQTSRSNMINYEFIGIGEIKNSSLKVYPNPARDIITLQCDARLIGSVFTIYDLTGREIKKGTLTTSKTEININNLSSGEYLLKVGDKSIKVVKE